MGKPKVVEGKDLTNVLTLEPTKARNIQSCTNFGSLAWIFSECCGKRLHVTRV